MIAYTIGGPFEAPVLREVAAPVPGQNELLIRVEATSVNPVDAMVASGFFTSVQEYRYPAVFGRDVCGVVEQVGPSVHGFVEGDRVWGFIKRDHIGDGTFAEYVTCSADRFVAHKPAELSILEAGSLGLAGVTALECVDALGLHEGDTLFVNRASGGVGAFAVQIARARGLRVIGTARAGSAETLVRELGADAVVDWTAGDVIDQVLTIAPEGVHGIVDLVRRDTSTTIGQDESDSRAAMRVLATRLLRDGGAFTSVTNGADDDLLARGVGINVHSEPTREHLDELNDLVAAGALRSPITSVFRFEDIGAAFEHQASAGTGKTAVAVDPALLP